MLQEIIKVVHFVFRIPVDQLEISTKLRDLKTWSSLAYMELILELEKNFNLQLTADEIVSISDINSIKEILEKRQNTHD